MADRLEIELALIDKEASKGADKAAAALAKVEANARKAEVAAKKASDAIANQMMASVSKANKQASKEADKLAQKMQQVADKAAARAKRDEMHRHEAAGWLGKGKEEFEHSVVKGFAAYEIVKGLLEGAHKAVELITEGVKMAFEAAGKQEKLALSYGLIFGKKGGAEKMEGQEEIAKKTRFTGSEVSQLMLPLFSSGMGQKAAEQAFATAADLEARTGRPIDEFIQMLGKINNKGGVTEKMLLGMNLNAHEFYKELGKVNKITAKEAKERAESGKIDPQALINQITSATNKAQGGEAGTGGKMLGETMSARLEKLSKLPEVYLEKMSESPAWQKLSDKLGGLLKELDPTSPRGQKIMAALFRAFDKLVEAADKFLSPQAIDTFVGGLEKVLAVVEKIFGVVGSVVDVVDSAAAHASVLTGDASDRQKDILKQESVFNKAAYVGTHPEEYGSDKAYNVAAKEVGVSPEILKQAAQIYGQGGKGKKDALEKYITVNVGDIHVTAPPGSDAKAHGALVAQEIGKQTNNLAQRSAQEAGAPL